MDLGTRDIGSVNLDHLRQAVAEIDEALNDERSLLASLRVRVAEAERRVADLDAARNANAKLLGEGTVVTVTNPSPASATGTVPQRLTGILTLPPPPTIRSGIVQALMDAGGPRDLASVVARVKVWFPNTTDKSVYETMRQLAKDPNVPVTKMDTDLYVYNAFLTNSRDDAPRPLGLGALLGRQNEEASQG